MDEDEIRLAATLISSERLASFIEIAGTERDAIKLHHQCLLLAAALMPVTALIEIALRNAICERLRLMFGIPNWLATPPPPFKWKKSELGKIVEAGRMARRAVYAKKSALEKKALDLLAYPAGVPVNIGHAKRSKDRQAVVQVTVGQLISQISMFFWKRLFSDDYENTLWKRSLKDLFPNKKLPRAEISAHLEVIYQARNRIAHHESIMGQRLAIVLSSIEFLALNFGMKEPSEDGVLAKMTLPFREKLAAEAAAMNALVASLTVP